MSKTKLLAVFLGGIAAGTAIALLTAPQSGKETRKKIKVAKDKSMDYMDDLVDEGKKTWYQAKGKTKESAGVAADELDSFMRHILATGKNWWKGAKKQAEDVADMTRAISEVLEDEKLRADLIKCGTKQFKKFSWSKMAKQTLDIYRSSLDA